MREKQGDRSRARVEIIVYDNFISVDLHKSSTDERIYIIRLRVHEWDPNARFAFDSLLHATRKQ